VRSRQVFLSYGTVMLLLIGCAGKGEVIAVNIPAKHQAVEATAKNPGGPHVAVMAFEDGRSNKTRLGTRTHLFGGESHFNLPNGADPSEATALALVEYLAKKGWNASLVKAGGTNGADVTISGKILELSIDAKSGFGSTEIVAKNKLVLQAKNQADGSLVRETLNGLGTDSVFWFDPKDGQDLINEVLERNFDKFLSDTTIEGKSLRLK